MSNKFTLLEVLLVTLIMGLMASTALMLVDNVDNQERYDETKERLNKIKTAILGPENLSQNGKLIHWGYLADTGEPPKVLENLLEDSDTPIEGWNGPYLTSFINNYSGQTAIKDGWGNKFGYTKTPSTFTISSNGSGDDSEYKDGVSLVINTNNLIQYKLKYEETLRRLQQIKEALLGRPGSLDGYIADMGQLPSDSNNNLTDLISKPPAVPTSSIESTLSKDNHGLAHGWRGKYIDFEEDSKVKDAWGNEFKFTISSGDLTINSVGLDGEEDELPTDPSYDDSISGYNKDVILTIKQNEYLVSKTLNFNLTSLTGGTKKIRLILPSGQIKEDSSTLTSNNPALHNISFSAKAFESPEPAYSPTNSDDYFKVFYLEILDGNTSLYKKIFHQNSSSTIVIPDIVIP